MPLRRRLKICEGIFSCYHNASKEEVAVMWWALRREETRKLDFLQCLVQLKAGMSWWIFMKVGEKKKKPVHNDFSSRPNSIWHINTKLCGMILVYLNFITVQLMSFVLFTLFAMNCQLNHLEISSAMAKSPITLESPLPPPGSICIVVIAFIVIINT